MCKDSSVGQCVTFTFQCYSQTLFDLFHKQFVIRKLHVSCFTAEKHAVVYGLPYYARKPYLISLVSYFLLPSHVDEGAVS